MLFLGLGVAVWSAGHFMPSAFPGLREQLVDVAGPKLYRAGFSLVIIIGLILMILGYRSAAFDPVYDPPAWGVHANNLLMLIAVYLFGVSGAKGWVSSKLRHPMLLGVVAWALAHLAANGDAASILLFGGMGLWAVTSILLINRRTGGWARPHPAGAAAEIKLIVITLAIYATIAFAHGWLLGVNPFPG